MHALHNFNKCKLACVRNAGMLSACKHAGVRARMLACWRACENACPHAGVRAKTPARMRAKTPARMLETSARMHASPHTPCQQQIAPRLATPCVRKRLPACLKRLPACLLNACPHACFAAYALPVADRATPCPFRGTCNVLAPRPCIFKIEEFQSEVNVCKKDWNTVPIYSQHLVFFLFFVGGCDFVVSLYLETGDP